MHLSTSICRRSSTTVTIPAPTRARLITTKPRPNRHFTLNRRHGSQRLKDVPNVEGSTGLHRGVEGVRRRPRPLLAGGNVEVDERLGADGRARGPEVEGGEGQVGAHLDAATGASVLDGKVVVGSSLAEALEIGVDRLARREHALEERLLPAQDHRRVRGMLAPGAGGNAKPPEAAEDRRRSS